MYKVRTAPVIKLLAFALGVYSLTSCNMCSSNNISGDFSGSAHGSFIMRRVDTLAVEGNYQLKALLEKKGLDQNLQTEVLADLSQPENWKLTLNDSVIRPSLCFPELSNTMSPTLDLLLPLTIDPALWRAENNQLQIDFRSPHIEFTASLGPDELTCHTEYLQHN